MNYQPKKGDRVRVVLEGEVTRVAYDGSCFDLAGENTIVPNLDHTVSIEKLADPEPEWQTGDVVKTNIHHPFLRSFDHTWKVTGTGPDPQTAARIVSDAWANGELTILHRPAFLS